MNILVTYASIGGNTMMVAQKIEETLREGGQTDVELVDMDQMEPEKLTEFEMIFIGSSTWGDGEYNDFSQVFFDKLKTSSVDLSKTKCAIYGLGESFYPIFCNVVELMKNDLSAKNAQIIGEQLRIDGFPDDTIMGNVSNWVQSILQNL